MNDSTGLPKYARAALSTVRREVHDEHQQVLQLVRALFAAQIDREPNDLREWLLRQIVAALTIEAQGDPVRAALEAAIRSDNEATSQRAQRALLALDALVALDVLIADRDAERFARADADDALRRPRGDDGETRRSEAAGE